MPGLAPGRYEVSVAGAVGASHWSATRTVRLEAMGRDLRVEIPLGPARE